MSSNTPPPYTNITGITRAVMKDNAQTSLTDYNGNARPGELVVDQTTDHVYVGNVNGGLTQIAAGIADGGSSGLPAGFYQMAYNPTTGEIIYYT